MTRPATRGVGPAAPARGQCGRPGATRSAPRRASSCYRATVTNSRGELVTNLDQRAFTVEENGKRQPITLFRRDDVPISVGLLIDNSGSMRSLRAKVEAAALAFARASNPDDEIFVVNFADTVHLDVPMTADLRVLEAGIGRVDSIGGTALRDAVDLRRALPARSRHPRPTCAARHYRWQGQREPHQPRTHPAAGRAKPDHHSRHRALQRAGCRRSRRRAARTDRDDGTNGRNGATFRRTSSRSKRSP